LRLGKRFETLDLDQVYLLTVLNENSLIRLSL